MGQYQVNCSLCSHDFGSAKVNMSLDQPFSSILMQDCAVEAGKVAGEIWRSDLSCIVCNRWR